MKTILVICAAISVVGVCAGAEVKILFFFVGKIFSFSALPLNFYRKQK